MSTSKAEDDRSLIREDNSEFELGRTRLSLISGSFGADDACFSTHTPRLLDDAMKRRKTPRIPEQNLAQRDRR